MTKKQPCLTPHIMLPTRWVSFFLPKQFSREAVLTGFKARMDSKEAMLILNVRKTTKESVDKAYKRLMLINHPDRNGSAYLASKINDARTLLVKKLGNRG